MKLNRIFEGDKEAMLVIQERNEGRDEEGDRKIRIFSATDANEKIQLDYFRNMAYEMIKHGKSLPRLEESSGDNNLIAEILKKYRKLLG